MGLEVRMVDYSQGSMGVAFLRQSVEVEEERIPSSSLLSSSSSSFFPSSLPPSSLQKGNSEI